MSRKSGNRFSDKDMRQSMLSVENIDVFYGDAQALDGVSLEVEEGAIVAIVGANGAGKTSLIRTIAGMLRPGSVRESGLWITCPIAPRSRPAATVNGLSDTP